MFGYNLSQETFWVWFRRPVQGHQVAAHAHCHLSAGSPGWCGSAAGPAAALSSTLSTLSLTAGPDAWLAPWQRTPASPAGHLHHPGSRHRLRETDMGFSPFSWIPICPCINSYLPFPVAHPANFKLQNPVWRPQLYRSSWLTYTSTKVQVPARNHIYVIS